MIYADFESVLVPGNNVKQNPNESYTNKYRKHVPCSYGYKLVCFFLVTLFRVGFCFIRSLPYGS